MMKKSRNWMKNEALVPATLVALLGLCGSAVGCEGETDGERGPRDNCRGQAVGCGDPLLHYWLTPELGDGEYRITVESPDGVFVCTMIRDGVNDVEVPIVSFACDDATFEEDADLRSDGLSFFDWQPETITLTVEDVTTGCLISQMDEPVYEAQYDECGDNACIDAWAKWDITELHARLSGMGGAGGVGGP